MSNVPQPPKFNVPVQPKQGFPAQPQFAPPPFQKAPEAKQAPVFPQPTMNQAGVPTQAPQPASSGSGLPPQPTFVEPEGVSLETRPEYIPGPNDPPLPAEMYPENLPPQPAFDNEPKVIRTDRDKKDGLDKCVRCGSTEIFYDMKAGLLTCEFCRYQWNEANAATTFGFDTNIGDLVGVTHGSGAGDITTDDSTVTIKCQGCGAEVVVSVANAMQTRCHWCRQVLSVNTQVPNGAVPDAILPFDVQHSDAVEIIRKFADERKFFAWRKFREEFTPENVVGVYMPYMVIDGNLSAEIVGKGEILTREYTVTTGVGDNKRSETRYDADVYQVARRFDYTVDDLMTESSNARSNMSGEKDTNNIINAILPFDTKNAVAYNSNYLAKFTSEKRDLSLHQLDGTVQNQFLSIARAKATEAAKQYDRGIRWEAESLDVHGTRWVAVYVPIWLYSYYVDRGNGNSFVHYIAVNGRNGHVMGSIPISYPKLWAVTGTIFALTSLPTFGIVGSLFL